MNRLHSRTMQQIINLTVIHKRREKSQKVDYIAFLFPGSSNEYKDCLTCTIGGFRPSLVSAYI